jgi:hypothetical protein
MMMKVNALGDGEASFGEGGDRKTSLCLHEDEVELIKAVGPLILEGKINLTNLVTTNKKEVSAAISFCSLTSLG